MLSNWILFSFISPYNHLIIWTQCIMLYWMFSGLFHGNDSSRKRVFISFVSVWTDEIDFVQKLSSRNNKNSFLYPYSPVNSDKHIFILFLFDNLQFKWVNKIDKYFHSASTQFASEIILFSYSSQVIIFFFRVEQN